MFHGVKVAAFKRTRPQHFVLWIENHDPFSTTNPIIAIMFERLVSPASHTTPERSSLADESRAIRGRVRAVVRHRRRFIISIL